MIQLKMDPCSCLNNFLSAPLHGHFPLFCPMITLFLLHLQLMATVLPVVNWWKCGTVQLRRLGLAGNRLQELPASIGDLQQLEGLWITGNMLHSLPAEVCLNCITEWCVILLWNLQVKCDRKVAVCKWSLHLTWIFEKWRE
jgi:Leucine-rich repeat (LRR) protein